MDNSRRTSSGNKIFVVVAAVLAVTNLIDFLFYGRELRNLAGAAGFALMAFGVLRNLGWASISGAVLAASALIAKYVL